MTLTRGADRVAARVDLLDPNLTVLGTRSLDAGSGDCGELLQAVALSVGIALDRIERATPPPEPVLPTPVAPAPASFEASPAPVAPPPSRTYRPTIDVAAGLSAWVGTAPNIAKLLGAERARRGPPKVVRSRVRERVNASILVPATPPTHAPHPPAVVPHTVPILKAIAVAIGTMGPVARTVAMVASITVAGTAVGVLTAPREPPDGTSVVVTARPQIEASGGGRASSPRRALEAIPLLASPAASSARAPSTVMTVHPASSTARRAPTPRDTASVAAPSPPAALSPAPGTETLAAERSLLDEARSALRAGDAPGALGDLDLHAQRFPAGVLAEERDAMRVEALVAAGRVDDARAAGERFRRAHSGSLLQPMVEDALESIP